MSLVIYFTDAKRAQYPSLVESKQTNDFFFIALIGFDMY